MAELWQIIVLAIIQGITEFLPISSDGHLVVGYALLGMKEELVDITITLHLGTLLSILVIYWTQVWRLLGEDRRVIPLILIGTIPAVLFGLPMKKYGEAILTDVFVTGFMLILTGSLLFLLGRMRSGKTEYQQLSVRNAFLIGCAQATAIMPGLSRSGTTITSGVALGLSRKSAATFSFLLGIPAMAGAVLLEIISIIKGKEEVNAAGETIVHSLQTPVAYLAIGAVVSFLVGIVALKLLIRWLEKGKIHYLGWWCVALGIGILAWKGSELAGWI